MQNKLSTPDIITLVAGGVMLIGGFLAFYDEGGQSENVFGDFVFGVPFFVWLLGIVAGVHIALVAFANVNLPAQILDFTWDQIHLVIGGFCGLVMLAFLIQDFDVDKGIGYWLMLLAGIGLAVGAFLRVQQPSAASSGGNVPPTPF